MKQVLGVAEIRASETASNRSGQIERAIPFHQIVLVLALALTFIAYCGSLGYEFVYDDHLQIVANSFVHSWRFVPRYFTQEVWESLFPGMIPNYYRPIFLLWLRLSYMLFGANPWGWHLTCVFAHLSVTLLVYFLAEKILHDRVCAAFGALIFGLHPVHIEAVVWVSGVTEPLVSILFISSFLCYLRAQRGARPDLFWFGVSLLLYVVSLFAKEIAIVLPALIFAYEWTLSTSIEDTSPISRNHQVYKAIRSSVPYLGITLAYLVPRVIALKGLCHVVTPLSLSTVVLTWPSFLWFYLRLLVWPLGLSLSYDLHYVKTPGFLNFVLPLAGLAAAAFLLWVWARLPVKGTTGPCRRSRARVVGFASAWLVLPILPVLHLQVLPTNDALHDRFLYLPSVGFAMIAALALRSLEVAPAKFLGQPVFQALVAVAIALFFVMGTLFQSLFWSNDVLLYRHGISVAPNNGGLKSNLAYALASQGRYEEATGIWRDQLVLNPNSWDANYNLGLICYRLGKFGEAQKYFERATESDRTKGAPFFYLGLTELKLGHLEQATGAINRSLRINPDIYGVHFARGIALKLQDNLPAALEEFKQELTLNPEQQIAREQIAEIEQRLRSR